MTTSVSVAGSRAAVSVMSPDIVAAAAGIMPPCIAHLRPIDAARYLGLAVATLAKQRSQRVGPRFSRLGRVILYDVADLDAWLRAHKTDSSSRDERLAG